MIIYPTLAQHLVLIHRSISRGQAVGISKGVEFQQFGLPTPHIRQGYADYLCSLVTLMSAHHAAEDQVLFPAIMFKLGSAPIFRLSTEHEKIAGLLEALKPVIEKVATGLAPGEMKGLADAQQEIYALWQPHMQLEEQNFSEAGLRAAISQPEQTSLAEDLGSYLNENVSPRELVIPFLLYNLEESDRRLMAASLPRIVTGELVANNWQPRWASMQPFLLR